MYVRHAADTTSGAKLRAEVVAPIMTDAQLVAALQHANVRFDGLAVHNVDGIIIINGTATHTPPRKPSRRSTPSASPAWRTW
jgi:hypothetical protein